MSGHSKWKTIAAKKGKTDAQRGKIFTKLSREIIVAVKEGGSSDPRSNSKLKDVIAKARAANVPNDNIKRVIEKAGSADASDYESVTYEGYGAGGVAVIVEAMTDNRNRTASEMRHYFDKYGGNMGTAGCVGWSFDKKGVLVMERGKLDEDTVMMDALEAGATDFDAGEDMFEIYTDADSFSSVAEALNKYTFVSAQVEMIPQTYIKLTSEEDIAKLQKMLDLMEDNEDVQDVWHNWEE